MTREIRSSNVEKRSVPRSPLSFFGFRHSTLGIAKSVLGPAFRFVSGASAKLVHQPEDAFADLKQLLPRVRNHRLRQKLLRRDGFQSGLGLVQMIQRALQVRDRESSVSKTLATRNVVQRSGQLCAGRLKLKDELTQIVVG